MKRNCTRWLCWMLILTLLSSLPLFATKIKEGKDRLDSLTFHAERTWKTSHGKSLESVLNIVPSSILMDFERFNAASGGWWTMTFDTVTGKPQKYEGGVPWIPGTGLGNSLTAADLGVTNLQASTNSIPVDIVSQKAMKFMEEYPELLGVDPGDLVLQKEASGPMLDYLYSLNYQWTYHGIPVEHAHVGFYLNSGNLVMFGQDYISDSIKKLDPRPSITPEIAGEIMWSYLGEKQDINDVMIENGRLIVQPMVSEEVQNGVEYAPGTGMSYALVYIFVFQRKGVTGTWEARVDAHTGEMISFKDINAYGKIQGGVYKTDKNPWQTDETMPLAFADYGSGVYADSAGLFAGTTGTSTLTGRPGGSGMVGGVDIVDNCGAISLAADGTGLIDFGVSAGTDCTTPGVGGAGNTHSSRTQYYHVTNIKVKAFTYFPSNTWLQGVITDNVNINDTCNAYWSGGATGNANFFRSGGGCGNTGELPGVSLHEVGHGWDYNDGNGFSPEGGTGEVYGDITAMLETHQSCAGGGFFMSYDPGCGTPPSQNSSYHNCGGYGNCCLDCSGIREADYEKHATPTPATPNGFNLVNCPDGYSCEGPCSRECHCENAPGTQAMWDLVVRDFTASPYNMDLATAWMYADKFWYASAANRLGAFVCGNNTSTAVGNMFNQFRVVDDCDGNLTNGTPHAAGIWAAFSRHQIGNSSAVNTDNDCGCTSLTTPVVSGTAGNQSANLTWPAVTGAASYDIYRNMTSCDAGYTKIGNTASTSYPDSPLSNGVTYYYKVQAKGTGSCPPSAMSNCVTLTPQPCTASILLGQTLYACASTVEVDVLDSTPGSSPWTGVAWSTSDATQRSFTLTGPAPNLSGSFTTTTGAGGPGVVHVANGDTLYVRFVDPDNCGGGSYNANATASIDCTGPTISNVAVTNITGNSATVTWDTNENANSRVTYGTSTPPGTNADNLASYVTSHTINLTGLTPCTQYYFSVTSADVAGNSVTDTNGGSYYTFTTPNTPVTVWSENFTSATPTALPAGWS
ncbi:MAG TPA: hypothetical protein PLA03_11400, partial [Acidobacteriota bacterium]|nr:hypothetical protein [Acidobacteriota bacterium]